MAKFKAAHIRRQSVNLIIIPLDSSFGRRTTSEQNQPTGALQVCASAAGLTGTVVPVWDAGGGRMAFLAPSNWRSFFQGIDLSFVTRNINRGLTCA